MITTIFKKAFLLTTLIILPNFLFSQYQVNGSAVSLSCNCYQLTSNSQNLSGSVWNTNNISLNQAFDFTFEIYLGCNDGGADGMVFGLQPIGTGVGTSGGGMGFQGVSPSIGFFIDTYTNGGDFDPVADHFSINANGVIAHDGGVNDYAGPASLPFNIEDCAWHTMRVTWDPATLTLQGYIDGVFYLTYTGDIIANVFSGNPNVFWGMTAATGGATNLQQFCTELNTEWATDLPDYTCLGQAMQFSDSTASFGQIVDWSWDFGDGNTSALQNPSHLYTADGVYNVVLTVTDASGCQDNISHPVIVASPTLTPSAFPSAICPGFDAQLNAGLNHPFASQYNYTWTPIASLSDPSLANPVATPAATTMYYVTALDPITGCSANDSLLITIAVPPNFDPISDVAVCESYVFPSLQGVGLTVGAAYFTGTGGSGTQYNVGDSYSIVGTTTIYAYDDNGGCLDEESFNLTILPSPSVDLGADVSICITDQVVLDATAAGVSYNWIDNSTNPTLTVSAAGNYWVEVTENGCTNSDTVQVTLLALPIFTLGADTLVCEIPFQVSPSELYTSYLWQDGSSNVTFTIVVPGNYNVTVTDAFGCVGNASIEIGNGCIPVITVPNVFTPNSDEVNDIFFAQAENITEYKMVIVNRWGNIMREFDSVNDAWDGTALNGDLASQGVYFWKINYSYVQGTETISEEVSGNVTLIRD
ncbi:MAG: gliding motility-associated C-terminal domain-containing protein [Crocinitomicaceae bacterium]|nr:PKD domain-containing protein [Flavobacteriales bacterium]NQZ37097.1 gliding motility-associated C-terminal domain-containing protein [Crocinitomicaceae bacterium]